MPRAAVALGGNAVTPGADADFETQMEAVRTTVAGLAGLRERGYDLLCTHGNGPQVGTRLLEQEASDAPDRPLDLLVAQTQAGLGAMLQRALDDALAEQFLTVVTQVVVDGDDPAFEDPSKPVGPYYTADEAGAEPFETARVEGGPSEARAYRRVVPSPAPQSVVEAEEIAAMVDRGQGVVCGGGGGVPMVRTESGLEGVPAVVDKDHTTRLLAEAADAEELVFLTDVDGAYLDFGTAGERRIESATPREMREYLDAGEFGEGAMGPKVEACLEFLGSGGDRAVICLPGEVEAAVDGDAGTRIA
jgi:carbamate kinase